MRIRTGLAVLSTLFILASCANSSDTKEKKVSTFSNGRMNTINVVMESDQWKGDVGDGLRDILAKPALGLPTDEPLFTINQLNAETFTGFQKEKRLLLEIITSDRDEITIEKDVYAIPQTVVKVYGSNDSDIAALLNTNEERIVSALKTQELKERQRRISKNLQKVDAMKRELGVSFKFPQAYRYAAKDPDFFWMTKDLKIGEMNIMVYEVPINTIDRDTNTIARIIRMRDSVGSRRIPVDNGRFITQTDFAPYLHKTSLDGKPTWETRGLWEVDGQSMGGPFVNYAIQDKARNRYVILEGFIHSPSIDKRDNMFELDAILRTAKLED
ncbi:MAG: DUF4837 family protein [Dokdonia sp.]|nr:DUF4837 family protein [Dokdonia sp.]